MKFKVEVKTRVYDGDDFGGESYNLFGRLSCNAGSKGDAERFARKVLKEIHPDRRSSTSATTFKIESVTVKPIVKTSTKRRILHSLFEAKGAWSAAGMGTSAKGGSDTQLTWRRVSVK